MTAPPGTPKGRTGCGAWGHLRTFCAGVILATAFAAFENNRSHVVRRLQGSGSMQLPLQVTFHNLTASESVEQEVRQHATQLEAAFPRMVSCRVLIDVPHRHQHQGRRYRVRVEVGVSGVRAVGGQAGDEHAENEDVHLAIRDAFRAVRRQLDAHAGRRDAGSRPQTV
jgi:ribosome-associated translation inhibitor RaiA